MDDGLVDQFTSITSSTSSIARQYLRLGDNNLEQAIGLYFANEGAELEPTAVEGQAPAVPPPSTRPQTHPAGYTDDNGIVHLDSDNEGDIESTREANHDGATARGVHPSVGSDDTGHGGVESSRDTVPSEARDGLLESDAEMARRLQEEMYGAGQPGSSTGAPTDEFGYRAPIARTTQTLVGPDAYDPNDAEDMRAAVIEQMMARRQARPRERPGIFNQDPNTVWNQPDSESSSRRDILSQATAGASESSSKANALAEMYRPPFELISRLSWDEARSEGKAEEKWILVNIQDPSIFDCQVLNRDLWKHPGIVETVKENFLFMQYSKDNPRGSQYIQYYFPNKDLDSSYPHIAIVDPRTGEQVKVWSGPPAPKAMDFLMQLHEFLDRYSLKASAKNPVAKRKPQPKKEAQLDRMTEEQQMEMALQASLAGADGQNRESDPDDLTRSIGNLAQPKDEAMAEVEDDQNPAAANGTTDTSKSAFSSISSLSPHTEPEADPATTTRIQFRHPNGRVVRRFALADPVRRIFEWLKSSPIDGKTGVEFGLTFMQKNLMTVLDESIEEAGLRNGTVMIEFDEAG